MHTYNKSGTRLVKLQNKKEVKKHLKGFYEMLGKTSELAEDLKALDVEITEDNINEYAEPIIGRKLDNMEKFLVLGKLNNNEESN